MELDRGEPLHGRLGPVAGPLEAFSGWIGLAAAIDRTLQAHERKSEPSVPPGD